MVKATTALQAIASEVLPKVHPAIVVRAKAKEDTITAPSPAPAPARVEARDRKVSRVARDTPTQVPQKVKDHPILVQLELPPKATDVHTLVLLGLAQEVRATVALVRVIAIAAAASREVRVAVAVAAAVPVIRARQRAKVIQAPVN